ncbi:MAG TPA: lytic polysaccharide monooxygenase auxiliary activity family 9 protein [Arsenophonus nasoniae]|uniref:lytic polysaccharide monooxygenase auxiliary activity family 9 protein n=1 Tax=Arsenophonus nasoniae TaxID=638 RepID=UPI00387A4D25
MPNSFIQNNGETLDNIQPAHGRIITPASRGHFASINGWWGLGWETNELEGGKNFPETKSGPCIREPSDVASSTPPKDGLIVSGGRTGERAYLNSTDNELITEGKIPWPKHPVPKDGLQHFIWEYTQQHKTRGYVAYITKNGWDTTTRLTRNHFELTPFFEDISPDVPFWSYDLPVKYEHDIQLPVNRKKGHHVIVVLWIIADTGMAFYQTFDFDFDKQI